MKIMIVEDEPDILQGMKQTLQDLGLDNLEVLAFDHAESALLAIEREMPEIVLTDIVMEGMTGLEMIARAKRSEAQPKWIVVSGYGQFEYARQSLQLGVLDYILKPFDREEFRQKILTLVKMVEEEAAERRKTNGLQPFAELGARALRDKFVLGLCLEKASMQEHLIHRLKFWNLDWLARDHFAVLAVDCPAETAADGRLSEPELELRRFAVGNIGEELIASFEPAIHLQAPSKCWLFLTAEAHALPLAERLEQAVRKYQKYPVRIGVSDCARSLQSLPEACGQASAALRYALLCGGAPICRYEEVLERAGTDDPADSLAEAIAASDEWSIAQHIGRIVGGWVVSGQAQSPSELQRLCLDLIARMHSVLGERLRGGHQHISVELWERLEACVTVPEMQRFLLDHCRDLTRRLLLTHENLVIEQALQWIHEQFTRDITLQELAEHVRMSSVWLSQLFKRETGKTFSEYVVDLRIREAKRLLRETTLKIYEIAEKVGYSNLQHFGQTFKKKCGMSPKEYRCGR